MPAREDFGVLVTKTQRGPCVRSRSSLRPNALTTFPGDPHSEGRSHAPRAVLAGSPAGLAALHAPPLWESANIQFAAGVEAVAVSTLNGRLFGYAVEFKADTRRKNVPVGTRDLEVDRPAVDGVHRPTAHVESVIGRPTINSPR